MQKANNLLDFNKNNYSNQMFKKELAGVYKKALQSRIIGTVRLGSLEYFFLRDQFHRVFGKIGRYYICAGAFYGGELFQNNSIVV